MFQPNETQQQQQQQQLIEVDDNNQKSICSSSSTPSTTNNNNNNLHVVTENGDQCFIWRLNQLTYIAQDRQELPQVLANKFGQLATKLDLSYNSLTSFKNINLFTNLSELILDNNSLTDDQLEFKQNLRLKTLSLNKNKLTDLYKLIITIRVSFPNLEFLSLIGNPLCPSAILQSINEATKRQIHEAHSISSSGATESLDGASNNHNNNNKADPRISRTPHKRDDDCFATQMIEEQNFDFAYQKYRYFIIYHLPNLRFLDSNPISGQERDEALKRCYWMETLTATSQHRQKHNNNYNCEVAIELLGNSTRETQERLTGVPDEQKIELGRRRQQQQPQLQPQPQNVRLQQANGIHPTTLATKQRANNNNNNNNDDDDGFRLTIMSNYDEDPAGCQHHHQQPVGMAELDVDVAAEAAAVWSLQPRGAFSRLSFVYTGKNSEGNRFIRNQDL